MTTRPFHDVCAGYFQTRLDAARAAGDSEAEHTALRLMRELADRAVAQRSIPRADAVDTVVRFDSSTSHESDPMSLPKPVRKDKPVAAPDVDSAAQAMRLDHATQWCTTDAERKQVQQRLAEQSAQAKELASFRDQRARFDAATVVSCIACESMIGADLTKCPHCGVAQSPVERAQSAMKKRNANAWKAPLRGTNQRSAGTIGTSKFDDDGGDAA